MRVHELAKELNIKSQDIIETLSGTDYAVKSASSGIEDEAQKVVRNKFAKKDEPKADTKQEAKSEDKSADRPKKNQIITAVFNAQYSKQAKRKPASNNNQSKRVVQIMDREQQIRVETEREITHSTRP